MGNQSKDYSEKLQALEALGAPKDSVIADLQQKLDQAEEDLHKQRSNVEQLQWVCNDHESQIMAQANEILHLQVWRTREIFNQWLN